MKFSILITSYNKGQYIEKCIQSCLKQDEKNYEILIFDNHSEDNSDLIFSKYANSIELFKRKKISNYSAMNQIDLLIKAFEVSKGDIICLLDGDDYFFPNKLNEVKKYFLKNQSVDILFDKPFIKNFDSLNRFHIKKKIQKNIWPQTIPTSSISLRREFMQKCINEKLFENYYNLEIDFRLNVFSQNINNNYKIIDLGITVYRQIEKLNLNRNKLG